MPRLRLARPPTAVDAVALLDLLAQALAPRLAELLAPRGDASALVDVLAVVPGPRPRPMTSSAIAERGRAMAEFCRRARSRGQIAEVEEREDLPCLRAAWLIARAAEQAIGRRRYAR